MNHMNQNDRELLDFIDSSYDSQLSDLKSIPLNDVISQDQYKELLQNIKNQTSTPIINTTNNFKYHNNVFIQTNRNKRLYDNKLFTQSNSVNKNQQVNHYKSSNYYFQQYLKWKNNEENPNVQPKSSQILARQPNKSQSKPIKNISSQHQYKQWKIIQQNQDLQRLQISQKDYIRSKMRVIEKQYKLKMQQILANNKFQQDNKQQADHKLQDNSLRQQTKQYFKVQKHNQTQTINQVIDQNQSQQQIEQTIHQDIQKDKLKDFCFQNMIQRKPTYIAQIKEILHQSQSNQNNLPTKRSTTNKQLQLIQQIKYDHSLIPTQSPRKQPIIKVSIQKLLQLPYREFLLFFQQNNKKLIRMTNLQEYKKLQNYQQKCFDRFQAVHKLRNKFSSQQGVRMVKKLNSQQKEKLFKILYHQE